MIKNQIAFKQEYEKWSVADHDGTYTGTPVDSIARIQKGDLVAIIASAKGGKTTFIHWYLAQLTMVADWHIALVDFESETGEIFSQISALTNPYHTATHIHLISKVSTMAEVVYDMEEAKRLYNIDCIVIDPYSNLLGGDTTTYQINQDLADLQGAAKRLNVAVIIMCHPTKGAGKGEERLSLYSAMGSAAFAQRVDLGLTLITDYDTCTTTLRAELVRHRQRGKAGGSVELVYNPETNSYKQPESEDALDDLFQDEQPIKVRNKIDVEKTVNFSELQALRVNYYPKATADNVDNHNFVGLIEHATTTDPETVRHIDFLRQHVDEWSSKEKQDYKRIHIPAIAPSATFKPHADNRKGESIQGYTNVIAIDIDMKDNKGRSLIDIQKFINKNPYVFYSAISVSGQGMFAFIRLENVDSPERFKEYFMALQEYFKGKGIVIDKACSDPTRLRYVTNDPNPHTNPQALIWSYRTPRYIPMKQRGKYTISEDTTKKQFVSTNTMTDAQKMEYIISDVTKNGIVINPDHTDTLTMSASLANTFGKDGWEYFKALNTPKHSDNADDTKYETMYNQDVSNPSREASFGSIVELYKKAKGINNVDWSQPI